MYPILRILIVNEVHLIEKTVCGAGHDVEVDVDNFRVTLAGRILIDPDRHSLGIRLIGSVPIF
jgi:hypothetical protein